MITKEVNSHIVTKLRDLEKEHGIKILLAVESGSRAWGFPSQDSDYDVRFLYAQSENNYLSIKQPRDVIEMEIEHDEMLGVPLDVNGWDIRKGLFLALKSNPILLEWLQSPIVYVTDPTIVAEIWQYALQCSNLSHIQAHYLKLLQAIHKQIINEGQISVKQYCYLLRPALAFTWIKHFQTVPPMDMVSLRKGLAKIIDFDSDINHLISLKASAQESDASMRYQKIDQWVERIASESVAPYSTAWKSDHLDLGNQLFRTIIKKLDKK